MIWGNSAGPEVTPRQSKLLKLGVPLELLARLHPPGEAASPGAPQPGAAAKPSPSAVPPARNSSLSSLAPAFSVRLWLALRDFNASSTDSRIGCYEGLRTAERQAYLYSLGRSRPGSIVTNASTIYTSWHGYGCAADCVPILNGEWTWPNTDNKIWTKWLRIAARHDLATGLHWHFQDAPHTQPAFLNDYPLEKDKNLLRTSDLSLVWQSFDQYSLSNSYIDSL